MERNYNEMAFVPEEVEQGLHIDLINHLLDYNKKSEHGWYDIHITSDGYCTIVQWVDRSYKDDSECSKFRFVDYDDVVLKEVIFPDNHYEYLFKEDVEDRMNEWLKENPNYFKNEFGRWVNKDELISLDDLKGE